MEISDARYDEVEQAYAKAANAVVWAYTHWDLDAGIESALKNEMGDGVSDAVSDLLWAIGELLKDGRGLPEPRLLLRPVDHDPDPKTR